MQLGLGLQEGLGLQLEAGLLAKSGNRATTVVALAVDALAFTALASVLLQALTSLHFFLHSAICSGVQLAGLQFAGSHLTVFVSFAAVLAVV